MVVERVLQDYANQIKHLSLIRMHEIQAHTPKYLIKYLVLCQSQQSSLLIIEFVLKVCNINELHFICLKT